MKLLVCYQDHSFPCSTSDSSENIIHIIASAVRSFTQFVLLRGILLVLSDFLGHGFLFGKRLLLQTVQKPPRVLQSDSVSSLQQRWIQVRSAHELVRDCEQRGVHHQQVWQERPGARAPFLSRAKRTTAGSTDVAGWVWADAASANASETMSKSRAMSPLSSLSLPFFCASRGLCARSRAALSCWGSSASKSLSASSTWCCWIGSWIFPTTPHASAARGACTSWISFSVWSTALVSPFAPASDNLAPSSFAYNCVSD